MKSEKRMLLAFVLNAGFSVLELAGGILTGSIAIASDAVHDMGDAAGIGFSLLLEKRSQRPPDERYTYGYGRYSVLGSLITVCILLCGSLAVAYNAVQRIFHPVAVHYDGMILFAVVGLCVNGAAAFFTREGDSLNRKAINLHMLEDVLGWAVVLVGALVMRFTGLLLIDPLLSLGVSAFIFIHAVQHLKETMDVFLEKAPDGIHTHDMEAALCRLDGVQGVHHLHVWSMDGQSGFATLHVVTDRPDEIKKHVRHALYELGVTHVTIETETPDEHCDEIHCHPHTHTAHGHHHHHHHGH